MDWTPDGPVDVDQEKPSNGDEEGTDNPDEKGDGGDGGGDGGAKLPEAPLSVPPAGKDKTSSSPAPLKLDDPPKEPTPPAPEPKKKINEDDELAKRFERLKNLR